MLARGMKATAFNVFLFLFSFSLQAQTKIDPLLKMMARKSVVSANLAKMRVKDSTGRDLIDCFIKTSDPDRVAKKINNLGGQSRSIIGNLMTAYIPVDQIETIAGWPEVIYLESAKPLAKKMNEARAITQVDTVQAGTGLSQAYTGAGVIVGVVDASLDWNHPDFQEGTGKTRILYVWDQTQNGAGVSEIAGSAGVECTNTTIDDGTCKAIADGGGNAHGTHVTGIAAGSDSTYKGVAPDADIVFVFDGAQDANSGGTLSTSVVDAVNYIFQKATAANKAAVVNLSLGTSLGAHDDTSSLETGLNALVSGKEGRAIVNAAGNEDFQTNDPLADIFNGIHAAVNVASGTDKAFEFAVRDGETLKSDFDRQAIVEVWLDKGSSCTIEVDGLNAARSAKSIDTNGIAAGSSATDTSNANVSIDVDFTDDKNANNDKQHAVVSLTFASGASAETIANFAWDLIFRGNCTGDAWLYPDANSLISFTKDFDGTDHGFGYTYAQGDSNKTITIPGTASGVITAASFMGRDSWTDINGTKHFQNADPSISPDGALGATGGVASDISLFSSLGPTGDGRVKPDIAAPGEPIISTLASSSSEASGRKGDKTHFKEEGTSMSSPHVTGTVALLFEKNPCLKLADLKTAFAANATTDSFTEAVSATPNNIWGGGKLNALAAIQAVADKSSSCTIGTSGTSGGAASAKPASGCGGSMIVQSEPSRGAWETFLMFVFPLWLFLTIRKRRRA